MEHGSLSQRTPRVSTSIFPLIVGGAGKRSLKGGTQSGRGRGLGEKRGKKKKRGFEGLSG